MQAKSCSEACSPLSTDGRESKYTESDQAIENIALSYGDQTLTDEASIADSNQELVSYINMQDGYQIVVGNQPEELFDTQIQIISEHAGLWAFKYQGSWYAVTDLDQNGRLEVISSFMQGTGWYSSNSFYEVNEALDGLEEVKLQERKIASEADIVVDSIPVYYDSVDKAYYYIFDDTVRDGGGYYYDNKRSLSLVDGVLTEYILAYQTIIYGDSDISIACRDMEEKEISETEYNSIADTVYPDYIRKQASLFWFSFNEPNMESDSGERSTLTEKLLESFEGFQISDTIVK